MKLQVTKMPKTLIAILVCTGLSIYVQAQQVTVSLKNGTIKELITAIESQTQLRFTYRDVVVEKVGGINLAKRDADVKEVLAEALSGTSLDFTFITDHTVVIFPKQSKTADKTRKITGIVLSDKKQPLPGASVYVKDAPSLGTTTDVNGQFSMEIPRNATLVVSFVGFASREIQVTNQESISVQIHEDNQQLDELVVIGYGTVKKADLTGSVSTLKGSVVADRKSIQLTESLQGAIPGVLVTRSNNSPGASLSIKVRGITTINNSNPLIIIDGVPSDSMNKLNSNEIESINVLKDAASASIYGSRAAAGVILITTKRASETSLDFSYEYELGIDSPITLPRFVGVIDYMKMNNELRWNDAGNGSNEYPTFPKDQINNYMALNAENPDKYPNTNWRKLILKSLSTRQAHSLSLSGGSKNIRSKASVSYAKAEGLYANRDFERVIARVNNDFKINKLINSTLDLNLSRSYYEYPYNDPLYNMNIMPQVYPAVWANGSIAAGKNGNNPYASLKYGGTKGSYYNTVSAKSSVDLSLFKNFKISFVLSPTFNFDKVKSFRKKVVFYAESDPISPVGALEDATSTYLKEERNESYYITSQIFANYNRTIGRHSLNLMAGYESYYAKSESLFASRDQYALTEFPYLNNGPEDFRDNGGSAVETAYMSYFGRAIYSFGNKYLLQANIRKDASSRFHKDYRWATFPSFSVGWVVSQEEFLKEKEPISYLKLRASWGTLGNERIGNYPYQSTLAFGSSLNYLGNVVTPVLTAAQADYAIRNISWEKTASIDIGMDINFFGNRLSLSGDYYRKTTSDMLLQIQIPIYLGFNNPYQNTGKMNTRGFDIQVGWSDRKGDLSYSVSANLSDFKSIMGDLGGTEFLGDQVKKKGSEFNEWYGYLSDGILQTQAEVDNSPKLNKNVSIGDIRYVDVSGPDGKPDGKITPDYDRVLLGGSLPRYMYGANAFVSYKNFDFGMTIQGVGKQIVRKTAAMVKPNSGDFGNYQKLLAGSYWSKYNSEEQNIKAKYPRLSNNSSNANYALSDFWLFNGRYLRLKNITLGYTLPDKLTRMAMIKRMRIFTSVNDLFSISSFPDGWDPEVNSYSYPMTRTFLFGASITF